MEVSTFVEKTFSSKRNLANLWEKNFVSKWKLAKLRKKLRQQMEISKFVGKKLRQQMEYRKFMEENVVSKIVKKTSLANGSQQICGNSCVSKWQFVDCGRICLQNVACKDQKLLKDLREVWSEKVDALCFLLSEVTAATPRPLKMFVSKQTVCD